MRGGGCSSRSGPALFLAPSLCVVTRRPAAIYPADAGRAAVMPDWADRATALASLLLLLTCGYCNLTIILNLLGAAPEQFTFTVRIILRQFLLSHMSLQL